MYSFFTTPRPSPSGEGEVENKENHVPIQKSKATARRFDFRIRYSERITSLREAILLGFSN
jgi:hypothetical protein